MMKANNTLDYNPPNTWTCYTSAGATGAAKSNLAGVAKGIFFTCYYRLHAR